MTLPRFTSGSAGRLGFSDVNGFFERIDALRKRTPKDNRKGPPTGRIVTAKVASSVGDTHSWYEVMKSGTSFVAKIGGMSSTSNGDAFAHPIVGKVDQLAEMVVIVAQYEADGRLFYIPLANGPCACSGGGSCYFYQQCAPTTANLDYQYRKEIKKFYGAEIVESSLLTIQVQNADMALVSITPETYAWVSTGISGTTEAYFESFEKRGPGTFVQYFDICNPTDTPPAGCIPLCSFCTSSSTVKEAPSPAPVGSFEISITCFDPCEGYFELPAYREDYNLLVHEVAQSALETYMRQAANCYPGQVPETEFYEFMSENYEMVKLVGKKGCLGPGTFSEVTAFQPGPAWTPYCAVDPPCVDEGWCAGVGSCVPVPGAPDASLFNPNRLPRRGTWCNGQGVYDFHECQAICNGQLVRRWYCDDVRELTTTQEMVATVNVSVS